jgi:hypothetical protein
MEQVIPVQTLHLFPVLDKLLMELLASLSPGEWHKPTVAKLWNVKDVAAHLLDVSVRNIASLHHYQSSEPPPQINSYPGFSCFFKRAERHLGKSHEKGKPAIAYRTVGKRM